MFLIRTVFLEVSVFIFLLSYFKCKNFFFAFLSADATFRYLCSSILYIFFLHIAELTRTIHNDNKPTVELLKNIDLLQQTWLATTDSSLPPEMQLFDRQTHSNMRYSIPMFLSDLHHHHHHKPRVHTKTFISALTKDVSHFIFKFTGDRSYVLYDKNDITKVGFLETIINFIDNNELSLVIRPVILHSTADTLSINDGVYRCTNILYGTSHGSSIEIIHYKSLVQKLAFRYGTD
jgi:hypothetical protein